MIKRIAVAASIVFVALVVASAVWIRAHVVTHKEVLEDLEHLKLGMSRTEVRKAMRHQPSRVEHEEPGRERWHLPASSWGDYGVECGFDATGRLAWIQDSMGHVRTAAKPNP